MKTVLTIIVIGAVFGLRSEKFYHSTHLKNDQLDTSCYRVYKIDSINSFYLIYTKKGGRIYKIVSQKTEMSKDNRISIDNCYSFILHSIIYDSKDNSSSLKLAQVTCFDVSVNTTICLEGDSIRDLYKADNIRGLYYLKSKQLKK